MRLLINANPPRTITSQFSNSSFHRRCWSAGQGSGGHARRANRVACNAFGPSAADLDMVQVQADIYMHAIASMYSDFLSRCYYYADVINDAAVGAVSCSAIRRWRAERYFLGEAVAVVAGVGKGAATEG